AVARPADAPRAALPDGRPPRPRCGRRRAGRHLGPHPRGPPRGTGRPADLGRPRRADRPVRHPPRRLRRQAGRGRRPRDRHPGGPRHRHDRCRHRPPRTRIDPRDLGPRPPVPRRRGPLRQTFAREPVLLAVAGPVIALVVAFVLSAIVLLASGKNPTEPFALMFQQAAYSDIQVLIINQASMYYIAALAVAIGFRMNLFNIGVDGQYQLAAMMAAIVGAHADLPAALQIPLLLLTAVCTGAFWSGI